MRMHHWTGVHTVNVVLHRAQHSSARHSSGRLGCLLVNLECALPLGFLQCDQKPRMVESAWNTWYVSGVSTNTHLLALSLFHVANGEYFILVWD